MIGKKIKRLRLERGYSITELARLADVSKSYLSQIERGLQKNPSLQFLIKVAKPLETTVDFLLGDTYKKEPVLDDEWVVLIQQAIDDGLRVKDFHEYQNFLKYQEWLKEQNKA